jgi:hypothetical protein
MLFPGKANMPLTRVATLLFAAAFAAAGQNSRQLDISGANTWTDTGIDLKAGDTIKITATGELKYIDAGTSGPDGLSRGWMDLLRQLPMNDAGRGTLVGRITDNAAARSFLAGSRSERSAPVAGRLFLGINQASNDQPTGSYHVTIEVVAGQAQPAIANVQLPQFTQAMLDSIAPRVQDAQGNPGDRVNFVIIGSQDRLEAAYKTAGWVTVDKTVKDAVLRGLLASFSKEAYVTLPMSELMLFGRAQDYGYAQGETVRVVASRHHLRLWRAPFTVGGQTVWAGAGTHDIGFDRDQRNGGITHKIDPDTDGEREFIGQSLQHTGLVAKLEYMRPAQTVETAKTAHGEEFHSDGRTLIIYLQPDEPASGGTKFADLFCSVLTQKNPDTGEWGACDQYFEGASHSDLKLDAVSDKYRVLIVPGIMSSCLSDSPAFQEGQKTLHDQYNVSVSLLQVPNDPSEQNAKMIAQYLDSQSWGDTRKWIVLGYSKGAPDVMVALAKEAGAAEHVAAFVSVAGAVGGSPIADALPAAADKWIRQYNMKGCKGDLASGFKSLQRGVRAAFLAAYPRMPVPSYSIVTRSNNLNTSKALLQTWQLLSTYGPIQDGQLLKADAIVPQSTLLGIALADHFAVALPFDKSTDSMVRNGMDKTRYPRAALLEAIVRFVSTDLDGQASRK